MIFMNSIFISGRLARDPELRFTGGGVAVTTMILVNSKKPRNPNKPETVVTIEVQTFGKRAEACAEYLAKGSPVIVEAELAQRTWPVQGSDTPRKAHFLKVKNINFLSAAVDLAITEEPDGIEYGAE